MTSLLQIDRLNAVKIIKYFRNSMNLLIYLLVMSVVVSCISCASDELVFITDPAFNTFFLNDNTLRKDLSSAAKSYNFSLVFLEYDSLTKNSGSSTGRIVLELKKSLEKGSRFILSPMFSSLVVSDKPSEDQVISLLRGILPEQVVIWIPDKEALLGNYHKIIRDNTKGWYDAGLFAGENAGGNKVAFLYIVNDIAGEACAQAFAKGTEESSGYGTEILSFPKSAPVSEIRKTLESLKNENISILGIYAGVKTADIIQLAREFDLFIICEQAEWILGETAGNYGTIRENFPAEFEIIFSFLRQMATEELPEDVEKLSKSPLVVQGIMDFTEIK